MKRSVLIVAEGEHELSGGTTDAALPILVRRLLGDDIDLLPTTKRIRELSGHMHPGKGDHLSRKFVGIIRWAERLGYDAVVILIDQDDNPSRHKSASIAQETHLRHFLARLELQYGALTHGSLQTTRHFHKSWAQKFKCSPILKNTMIRSWRVMV